MVLAQASIEIARRAYDGHPDVLESVTRRFDSHPRRDEIWATIGWT